MNEEIDFQQEREWSLLLDRINQTLSQHDTDEATAARTAYVLVDCNLGH